jgi:hypothetical protein
VPRWQRALETLADGDCLIVTKLDRLARSTRDLLNTLAATAQYPFANFVRKILEVFIRDF